MVWANRLATLGFKTATEASAAEEHVGDTRRGEAVVANNRKIVDAAKRKHIGHITIGGIVISGPFVSYPFIKRIGLRDPWRSRRVQLQAKVIVHRYRDLLIGAKIALGRLDGRVPQ
jgi:hypothetical protein